MSFDNCLILTQDWFGFIKNYEFIKNNVNIYKYYDINAIIDYCKNNNIRVIIPITNPDISFVSKYKDVLNNNNICTLITDLTILDTLRNKSLCNKLLIENNFDVYLPKTLTTISVPCIMKHNYGYAGVDSYMINNIEDVPKDVSSSDFLIQELIYGNEEYATHILAKDGHIVKHVTNKHNHKKNIYIQGYTVVPSKTDMNITIGDDIINIFEEIMKSINFSGVCCIDYKIVNGIPKIFEINPRFGGSLIRNGNLLEIILTSYKECLINN
jgi:carbamoylphosphate synthase large subunit